MRAVKVNHKTLLPIPHTSFPRMYKTGSCGYRLVPPICGHGARNPGQADVWVGSWGKSVVLKSVAPEPHIPLRESRETWAAFLRAKLPPQICEFVYAALWCKLKVHARLEERIKLHTCPLCGCKETILHTWTQCRFMPLVHDLIHKYDGQVHVQIDTSSRQYRIMNLPSDHTLATIPGRCQSEAGPNLQAMIADFFRKRYPTAWWRKHALRVLNTYGRSNPSLNGRNTWAHHGVEL